MPQAQSVAVPPRLPLIVEPENRDQTTDKDAKLLNAYIEKTKRQEYFIYQRPGLGDSTQPSGTTGTGQGVYNWKGDIYSIVGGHLYKGSTDKGAVNTAGGVYRFSSCLGATPKLQLGNGVKAYNYDDGGGLVEITDVDFPSSFVKGWAYLDGTTYVATSAATIRGSDINDPVNWNALNTITAQIEPDGGVALGKQLVYVVIFKEWSTEIFYDAANSAGSPLGTVQGAKVNYGCVNQDSVQEIDGAHYWITTNRGSSVQIGKLENLKFEVISTPAVERLLDGATLTNVLSFQLKHDGHSFYVVTLKDENLTLAYDIRERMWAQWTDTNGNYFPIVSSTYKNTHEQLLQHESNGKIYVADNGYATDDGELIQVDIYTPPFDAGTERRKQLNVLTVVADQVQGSQLMVRHNDNDYQSRRWSNFRTIDMSQKRKFITNCGTFVTRDYNFRHRLPVRMPRLKAVELQFDIGTL